MAATGAQTEEHQFLQSHGRYIGVVFSLETSRWEGVDEHKDR